MTSRRTARCSRRARSTADLRPRRWDAPRLPQVGPWGIAGCAARRRRRTVLGLARGRPTPRARRPPRVRSRPASLRLQPAARPVHDGSLAPAPAAIRTTLQPQAPRTRRTLARSGRRGSRRASPPQPSRRRRLARRRRACLRRQPRLARRPSGLSLLHGALPDRHRLGLDRRPRPSQRLGPEPSPLDQATLSSSNAPSGSREPTPRSSSSSQAASLA